MAYQVLRILNRTLYNLSAVPGGQTIVLGIAGPIDVSEWSEITAYVRFHPGTTVAADPTFAQIQFFANGDSEIDPASLNGTAFAYQTLSTFIGFANGLKTTSGFMKMGALNPSTLGGSLNVALFVQPSLTGTLSLIMSIDLICKNNDPGSDYVEEREPLLSEVVD